MASTEQSGKTYQSSLIELSERARSIDVGAYEQTNAELCLDELVPLVSLLITEAIAIAQRALHHYDQLASQLPDHDPQETLRHSIRPMCPSEPSAVSNQGERCSVQIRRHMDALVHDDERGANVVADIAFMMLMELRAKDRALESLRQRQSTDVWDLVETCASGRRRVIKTCTALERVLCEVEGLPVRLDYRTELSLALEVRRHYSALRACIRPSDPPDDSNLTRRMRLIGTRIAMLVGNDIYPDLRLRDRVELRALQTRLIDWLREGSETRDGTRLWQDLVGFANLIAQINRRQELVDHDSVLTAELRTHLETRSHQGLLDDAIVARLKLLRGTAPAFDTLLARDVRSVDAWRTAFRALPAPGQAWSDQPAHPGFASWPPTPAVGTGGRR